MSAQTLVDGAKPGYEQRVRLAATTIKQHSRLDEQDSRDLAIKVLRAIDHIPAKIR